jgi:uncharacterized Zn finger protein
LAVTPTATCDPRAFWECPKRLPEELTPADAPTVPALLVKKGGDYPEFWRQTLSFPAAMEEVYAAVRKRNRDW